MKEINFKDTRGSSLFKIKNGSSIMLQALDNKPVSITCRYIDERSFYLKNARFSFKEFAELVEQNSCIFYPEHGTAKTYEIYQIHSDKEHDYPFMQSCISRTAIVDNALSLYKPVAKHRGGSNVAQDFVDLVDELLED